MNRSMLTLGAAASALTMSLAQPALAQEPPRNSGKVTYTECRKSPGTTGLAIGGVAGALIGGGIFGGLLGPLLGAAGGALAGRAIDRDSTKSKRCRLVREEHQETYETSRPNDQYEPGGYSQPYAAQPYAAQPHASEPYTNDPYAAPIREEDRDLVQPERS